MIVNTCEINGEEFVIVERTNYEKTFTTCR